MKLIRLHLQGFKSFKDKTTIQFDEGITGIVGPNGCGKSNIVDALFWVMGEQSAKHLRGTKMKDLIFAGSSKYTPGSFAEVTLVLENDTGKHIHIGSEVCKPAEIALTRKLYRNGETEYRINGQPARLKDIHEVFMDTGAGAKSYSIIAQGEINRLVQAKPEERRTMIEEVAGITKFKLRKRDSLKKIEQTQSNLNRLSDLQSEIYKNLKSLEKQAEKAEKARRLKDRIKHHGLIVDSHKEFDFLNDYINAKTILENNVITLEESTLKKDAIELALEDERNKKTDLMEKIDVEQAEFNEMSKTLAASEERLKFLKRSREDKEKAIETKTAENEELLSDIEERKLKLNELNEKIAELQNANFEGMDFNALEEQLEELKSQMEDRQASYDDLYASFETARNEFNEIDQKAFKNTSKIDEYSANLEDIMTEIEEIEKNTAQFSDELVELRKKTQEASESLEKSEIEFKKVKEDLEFKKNALKENDSKHRELSKEVITIESKRDSLVLLNKAGEGIKQGALSFIENGGEDFEVLGNLVECDDEYAKALEVLFEASFDSLVSNQTGVDAISTWAMNNTNHSFDFINTKSSYKVSDESIERLKVKGLSGIHSINSIVKINNDSFSHSLNNLFEGFFVVENLTSELAFKLTSDLNFRGLVSKDGSVFVLKDGDIVRVSARSKENEVMGVVQRNNLINELTEELNAKKETLNELDETVKSLEDDVAILTQKFEEIQDEFNKLNTDYASFKASLDSKEKTHGGVTSRLEILNNRKVQISQNKFDLLEQDEAIQKQRLDLNEKIENSEAILADAKEELETFKTEYETQRSDVLEKQANAKTFKTQVESFESQMEDVQNQITRYNEKLEANKTSLETMEEEIETCDSEVETLSMDNANQADTMSEKESYLNIIKDELTSLLTGMQEREAEVKDLTATINKIEKQNVELDLKTQQIIVDEEILVKNVYDLYKVNLRSILMSSLEITSSKLEDLCDISRMNIFEDIDGNEHITEYEEYSFEKRFPAALRESKEKYKRYRSDLNRLGEINWQAVEDYDRQKLRHDFLRSQEMELKKSLEDLETAINHIDEKSKTRFKEAFDEVNVRFEKVFPIIFGGGEARLEVVGDINSTECGIDIIAKPPGKKMQSINLMSGGEKAMTAVSLIFSIFLVKPSPFCLLDEVDAPLDDANVGRFNELLREMSSESQFILITHNKKTMELNDTLYGVTMQEPGVSKAVSVQLH
ncbi:MAG: chromosome segregation protein SMC [Bacteriovoracaceae bacterium]|jgi:chromosome segregation protein|nr:chromosome segregation protein SMC [Bacteriovoracaceae bacterium]